MISDEQARLAAEHLRQSRTPRRLSECDVPKEVIEAAVRAASSAPDVRPDRVADARARLVSGEPNPHEVASMMLSRIVGDSLR